MHPYIHSKAGEARTDELIRQAERYRRVDSFTPPTAPRRRSVWPRLLSVFRTDGSGNQHRPVTRHRPTPPAAEPATCPPPSEALE